MVVEGDTEVFFPLFVDSFLLSGLIIAKLGTPGLHCLFRQLRVITMIACVLSIPRGRSLRG